MLFNDDVMQWARARVPLDGLPDDAKIEFIGRLVANGYTSVIPASLFELKRPDGGKAYSWHQTHTTHHQ